MKSFQKQDKCLSNKNSVRAYSEVGIDTSDIFLFFFKIIIHLFTAVKSAKTSLKGGKADYVSDMVSKQYRSHSVQI